MKTVKFSPNGSSLKERMNLKKHGFKNSNFVRRVDFSFETLPNRRVIRRQFIMLHNLAWHSPPQIEKKWKHVYALFSKRYFGDAARHTARFANTWTANNWL